MTERPRRAALVRPPAPTPSETRLAALKRAKRTAVPIRSSFVQLPRSSATRPGPLHKLVQTGDRRALLAYLIVLGVTSAERDGTWYTRFDTAVWARLFGTTEHATMASARTAVVRTLKRLRDLELLDYYRPRGSVNVTVTLLREDGTGEPYTKPDGDAEADRYFTVRDGFWRRGLDLDVAAGGLSMPELAMLLTVLKEKPWTSFPEKYIDDRYGWSGDTAQRGLTGLTRRELVERREHYKTTPLSPLGWTMSWQYRPAAWLRRKQSKKSQP